MITIVVDRRRPFCTLTSKIVVDVMICNSFLHFSPFNDDENRSSSSIHFSESNEVIFALFYNDKSTKNNDFRFCKKDVR